MKLRPYQTEAIEAIEAGWKEYQKQLLVLPTGTGKTIVFSHLARRECLRHNKRIIILAHREELLEQAQQKLMLATGLHSALEKGQSTGHDTWLQVVVASVQTLHAKRLQRWDPKQVGLIVVDEAHHCLASTYKRVLEHFSESRVLGVTATPDRGDKKSLGDIFENIAYEYPIRQAIHDGFLCKIKAQLLPLKIDLSNVRLQKGDYNVNELDETVAPYLDRVADEIVAHAADRKTLVFVPLVRTSKAFADICTAKGLRAVHCDGQSEDRAKILAAFHRGEYTLLTNSSLLLEGYDCPDIDCCVVLRPTKSRALYAQMIGRGTRIAEGKSDLLILDFLWQTARHSLCVPASLFASSEEEAKNVMGRFKPGDDAMDLLKAEADAKADRERSLAKQLAAEAHRTKAVVDPMAFALSIHDEALMDYEPTMRWEMFPASDKQKMLLRRLGIDPESVRCKGHASKIIDVIFKRRDQKLCTVKQGNVLRKHGIDPTSISFQRASELIESISATWK